LLNSGAQPSALATAASRIQSVTVTDVRAILKIKNRNYEVARSFYINTFGDGDHSMRALTLTSVLLLASSALYPAFAIDAKTDVQTHMEQQKSTNENSGKTSTDQNSQSAGATSSSCWDVSNNMARDKSQTSGTSSANTDSTVGSSSKRAGTARPAGMPDC